MHAFDKDKLSNLIGKEVSPEDFSVRKANERSLVCLDGKKYDLNDNITVITCCDKPVAIAGVIGGLETSLPTLPLLFTLKELFLIQVLYENHQRSRHKNESSSRYEKGISSKNTIIAVTRAINL